MTAQSVYFDSSALVKLVVRERESVALRAWIPTDVRLATSELSRTEVIRSVRPFGPESVAIGRELFRGLDLLSLDRRLFDTAAVLEPATLRSLDAIHLASAMALRDDLLVLVTYDQRMLAGARALGLPVASPGSGATP
jgi:predicted nucleic acid-binding protein